MLQCTPLLQQQSESLCNAPLLDCSGRYGDCTGRRLLSGIPVQFVLEVSFAYNGVYLLHDAEKKYHVFVLPGESAQRAHQSSTLVLYVLPVVMYSPLQDGKPGLCAAAVLVGIDVSPEPGLRGPTNFAGLCGPALLDELETVLSAAGERFRCIL